MNLVIPTEDGRKFTPRKDLFLIFIDETGEESLSDPDCPIFRFIGIGIIASVCVSNTLESNTYRKKKLCL